MILLGRCEIVRLTPRIVAVNPCEAFCQCQLSLMDTVISAGRFPFSHLKPSGECSSAEKVSKGSMHSVPALTGALMCSEEEKI